MHPRRFTAPLALLVLASPALAQDVIGSERPGITIPPAVMPEGRFQVEVGAINFTRFRGDGLDADLWNVPAQLRYGLTPTIELRLASSAWNHLHDNTSGEDSDGVGDVELGTKIALSDSESGPKTAVIAGVRLPVGDDDFTTHQPGYDINFAAAWDVGHDLTLTGLLGIARTPIAGENATTGTIALSLGRSFTDRIGAYVEAGWFPDIDNSIDTAVAGGGVTYLLNDDLQVDVFGDFGLDDAAPEVMVGAGVSWRL